MCYYHSIPNSKLNIYIEIIICHPTTYNTIVKRLFDGWFYAADIQVVKYVSQSVLCTVREWKKCTTYPAWFSFHHSKAFTWKQGGGSLHVSFQGFLQSFKMLLKAGCASWRMLKTVHKRYGCIVRKVEEVEEALVCCYNTENRILCL